MKKGKVIIVSAPSGCGKSTILNHLFDRGEIDMQFSVSATNRPPRPGETDGVNYYFLTDEEFRKAVAEERFVEYEEVYMGRFYGTLKNEVERITAEGHNLVMDIDVKGALNVKRIYGDDAVCIFIAPPSVAALKERLEGRGTETPESIADRVGRAEYELSFADRFDHVVVNDNLDEAIDNVERLIKDFVK